MRMSAALDQTRLEAFGERALQIVNDAGLAFLLSIGHRTGLFDAMAGMQPAASAEIALAAGLNERYVREWLNGLAVGGVIEYDRAAATYRLPPEHAALLTRGAGPDNLAFQGQYLAMLGEVEDGIVEAFRHGGGVSYAHFPRFQGLMAAESAQSFDLALVDGVLQLAPGLTGRLTAGIDVADVGCGQGHAVNVMAGAFPASRFTGLDQSEEGIAAAWAEAEESGLSNVRFEVRDIATMAGEFDLVTAFDVVHDQARPREVLSSVHASLRPGGTFLCADIAASSDVAENLDHPLGPWLYTISLMHCMTVSLAAGGEGLGAMWGEQTALRYLREAGFTVDGARHVEGDPMNVYYLCRRN
jgi:2-polyprenyl-3-methyl-5-hydroxy-6-metoxy-1,4-benzoquinol methylase